MTMGEIIKSLRLKANMTQEELGNKLGVQKSAVRKWEKGEVENIKRSTIQSMSNLFQVSPTYIMGLEEWDEKYNKNDKLAKEVHLCELIEQTYGKETLELVNNFQKLDEIDKAKITERMAMLLEDEKYSFKKELLNA